ncbi:hypothetical protein DID88_001685 [Monilinia fructigena]|uniref:Uncharacterized protein n=1 Tax=Monilinia fructigena TaxID=38457 RepID=A0A395IWM0_9HELO|nr:hypothetical protein DID88_001685 [Monilinia fructigena]
MDSDEFEHVIQPLEGIKDEVERDRFENRASRFRKNIIRRSPNLDSNAPSTHLSIEVLKDHKIDYVLDEHDPEYVLIKRWVLNMNKISFGLQLVPYALEVTLHNGALTFDLNHEFGSSEPLPLG